MSQIKTVSELLKKIENYDKDERYMATSDLCEVLKKHAAASSSNNGEDVEMSDINTPTIDSATERRICEAVLRRVDDSSNDVQAIAVKTLGVLVTCVHEDQVVTIAERLGALVLDKSKSALRDVYAIGLRTLVTTVPIKMGDIVSNRLTAKLMDGISKNAAMIDAEAKEKEDRDAAKVAEEISLACLEILTELLTRFGALPFITRLHDGLLQVTMNGLSSKSHLVRKRAGNTIGCLSVVLSDDLLRRLVDNLLSQIDRADGIGRNGKRRSKRLLSKEDSTKELKPTDTTALIRTMCTVSGHVGHRLTQEQIDRLVPIFLKFCDPNDAITGDDMDDDEDGDSDDMEEEEDDAARTLANELRESCFNGFQSFILRRPVEVQPHLSQIVHAALAYMRYDPNFSYGDENTGAEDEDDEDEYDMEEDEEDEYEDDEDDYSDDDDDSWKVRRSAIRTLAAVVKTSDKNLTTLWNTKYSLRKNKSWQATVADALVNRFKERDENCRVDIIECFNCLLKITVDAASAGNLSFVASDAMETSDDVQVITDFRSSYANAIIGGCEKQLVAKKAGLQTKSASLSLLSTLSTAPGGLGDLKKIESLLQQVNTIFIATDGGAHSQGHASSKQLKLDALSLVDTIITSGQHDPVDVRNGLLNILLTQLCKLVQENWYKIILHTLKVLAKIPHLLADAKTEKNDMDSAASILYDAIEPRLAANDFDQDIKEGALEATASLISTCHQNLPTDKIHKLLSLILLRLKNETTRIAATKAIGTIAVEKQGMGKVDMSSNLTEFAAELSALLRQNNRSVKQHAIICLNTIITSHGTDILESAQGDLLDTVFKDLSANIFDSNDPHIHHLCLQTCLSILDRSSTCGKSVKDHLLPAIILLGTSSSIQEKALDSLLAVYKKVIVCNIVGFEELMSSLHSKLPKVPQTSEEKESLNESSTKKVIGSIAICMATITAVASEEERKGVVSSLMTSLESNITAENLYNSILALRMSGDLGCIIDLNTIENVGQKLQEIYFNSLDSSFEEVKNSAAYSLGRACVGSIDTFLPTILSELQKNQDKKKLLLLSALREMIVCHRLGFGTDIAPILAQIVTCLKTYFADKEEGVRTMVADCMGSLACLKPDDILPQLVHQMKQSEDTLVHWTTATAIKLTISSGCEEQHLAPFMPEFLTLLKSEDLNVKNAALLMVYTAVHHNPQLILPSMEEHVQPTLLDLSRLKKKRVIDLGPFKETIDDALPLRKVAVSIFSSCLEKCPSSIDIAQFMTVIAAGLADVEDVQLQVHQILISLCSQHSQEVSAAVDTFVDPLIKTINKKFGKKTGTELERAQEWVKSAVRVAYILARDTDAPNSSKFADFYARVKKDERSQMMLAELDEK